MLFLKKKKERQKAKVHTTQIEYKMIEKDGFEIIVDNEGNPLTDLKLLKLLRKNRNSIASSLNVPAYTIVSNKGLVSLATFKPETKDEFVSLYGLGEKTYQTYGVDMINLIKQFYKSDNELKENYPKNECIEGSYKFILDEDGKLLTDEILFNKLKEERRNLSKEYKRPVYYIISNLGLVSLATYKPITKEDFIKLPGLDEKTFKICGDKMLEIIINHLEP